MNVLSHKICTILTVIHRLPFSLYDETCSTLPPAILSVIYNPGCLVNMFGLKILGRLGRMTSLSRIHNLPAKQQFLNTVAVIQANKSFVPSFSSIELKSGDLLRDSAGFTWCAIRHKSQGKTKQKSKKGVKHINVEPEDMQELVDAEKMKSEMESIVEKLKSDFVKMRVRIDIGSIEQMMISTDGGDIPLNQIGQIAQKANMLQINLGASPQYIKAVRTAIENSGMNVNPQLEGNSVFIPVPKITREHREKMAKASKQMFNTTKSDLGHVLNGYNKQLKKNGVGYSEDLVRKVHQALIQIEHQYRDQAEEMMKQKQKEVLNEN